MKPPLKVYNTLSRTKEIFEPINPPMVGLYVCGPTVYGEPHLGHARPYITFDVVKRYLTKLGFKVRYVRNITDVGHLTDDDDAGEDKIQKKAKLEKLEPMEVVQKYTYSFREAMLKLNNLPPDIEPTASGHVIEQIEAIKKIIDAGYAYASNGSVYFDVEKYDKEYDYGTLSNRKTDDMLANTRSLSGQDEKKGRLDFALWKNAGPNHLMRWPSPWGMGYPGWHLECTAMSTRYLGNNFDIHGGGMDLLFPHHECEIAQSKAANGTQPAKYWMHNNLITINGQKMGKSLGNFINLSDIFTGNHPLLDKAYSPMTVRFFILQAHYRSTLDFSNEALEAARKGYLKLMNTVKMLNNIAPPNSPDTVDPKLENQIENWCNAAFFALNDDFNTAKALASVFNLVKKVQTFFNQPEQINRVSDKTFNLLKETIYAFFFDLLGLKEEPPANLSPVIDGLMDRYALAKQQKDYNTVDAIRTKFAQAGLVVRDTANGPFWAYAE